MYISISLYIPIIVGSVNIHIWLHLFRVLKSKEITEGFRCLVTVMGQASPAFEIDNARGPGGPGRGSNGVREIWQRSQGDGGKDQAKCWETPSKIYDGYGKIYEEMISKSSEILVYQQ